MVAFRVAEKVKEKAKSKQRQAEEQRVDSKERYRQHRYNGYVSTSFRQQ